MSINTYLLLCEFTDVALITDLRPRLDVFLALSFWPV